MPTFPEWGRWELTFTSHAQRPWIVIVEPDADVNLLVVVTVYEVPE